MQPDFYRFPNPKPTKNRIFSLNWSCNKGNDKCRVIPLNFTSKINFLYLIVLTMYYHLRSDEVTE